MSNLLDNLPLIFERLWPLARSIAGPGLRESLYIISEYLPLEIIEYPSGVGCFDWVVPDEWELNDAFLYGPSGELLISTKESNLVVVNYSLPFTGYLYLDELRPHLHSIPENPEAIPYRTAYYQRDWGLCIPQRLLDSLQEGKYYVDIQTNHYSGSMSTGEMVVKGRSSKEILITSYICHPSMANNELSGPLCVMLLADMLMRHGSLNYTYRFLFAPETIGSIAFIGRQHKHLKEQLYLGLQLAMVAEEDKIYLRLPRNADEICIRSVRNILNLNSYCDQIELIPWSPMGGGDQRQFTAHGNNFPFCYATRSPGGKFYGYHSSLDTLKENTYERITSTAKQMYNLLIDLDCDLALYPEELCCEPQLGKRNLYPTLGGKRASSQLRSLINVYGYSDGQTLLSDIALKTKSDISEITEAACQLLSHGLLKMSVK
ncbi:DUF4910 domain-containing protein [Synechococcus sp. AH-736-M20]|nr:DUF4910 domain-containing protein [Synechococcus sp. AH-736-M20]